MNEDILKLINLQTIDSEIAGLNHSIAQHRATVTGREQAIVEKQETVAAFRTKAELLNQKQEETKTEHDNAGVRIKDRQNKMMQVQTSREHQALLKEIEENKRLVKETEERILQFIEQIEQLEQEVVTLDNQCTAEQELLGEEVKTVTKAIKRIETAKKSKTRQRDAEMATLQAPHLKRYSMLLLKREGLAVVALYDSVCQGCYMTLPPQQVIEIRKAEKFNICPTCQRILYYKEPEEVVVDK